MNALSTRHKTLGSSISPFAADEEAATAAEYGIIAALIAAVIITAVSTLGTNLKDLFNKISGGVARGTAAG